MAGLAFAAIDVKRLCKVSGLPVAACEVLECCAADIDRSLQNLLNTLHQFLVAWLRNFSCAALRADAGKKERFIRIDISHTNDYFAIHDESLNSNVSGTTLLEQIVGMKFITQRLGTE